MFFLKPNLSYYTAPTFQLSWVAVCSYFIFVMKYFLIIIRNINYSSIRHDYPLCCPFLHFSLSNIYVQRKTGTKSAETFNSALRIYIYMYNHKDSVYIITKHIFISQNWSLELRLVIKIMEGDCFWQKLTGIDLKGTRLWSPVGASLITVRLIYFMFHLWFLCESQPKGMESHEYFNTSQKLFFFK